MGRDGNTEQACEEIDFIIIRFDISSADALEVLNLLLECLVNETTNETAIVYSYISTKENGTAAVLMNLPFSVLGLIPWFCDFSDSPMGSKPETFEDWLWKPLVTIGMAIVGVILTIGMAFVELFMMMADFFVAIFMNILPILSFILWLVILTIILVLAWIMFVFNLLFMITLLITISIFAYSMQSIIDMDISLNPNSIIISSPFDFTFGYLINFEYISSLKLNLPTLTGYLNSTDFAFEYSAGFSSTNISFTKFPNDILDRVYNYNPQQSSKENLRSSGDSSNNDDYTLLKRICEGISAAGMTIGFGATLVGILAGLAVIYRNNPIMKWVFYISLIAFGVSITLFIITALMFPENFPPWVLFGMGVGLVIVGGVCLVAAIYMGITNYAFMEKYKILGSEKLYAKLGIIDVFLAVLGAAMDSQDFLIENIGMNDLFQMSKEEELKKLISGAVVSSIAGSLSLFICSQALVFLGGQNKKCFGGKHYLDRSEKTLIALGFGGLYLGLGVWLILEALNIC